MSIGSEKHIKEKKEDTANIPSNVDVVSFSFFSSTSFLQKEYKGDEKTHKNNNNNVEDENALLVYSAKHEATSQTNASVTYLPFVFLAIFFHLLPHQLFMCTYSLKLLSSFFFLFFFFLFFSILCT